MAIIGYQPVPSDDDGPFQANFQDSNGRSFLMFGPEAEQAAQRLDLQNKVQPDMRTADNSSTADPYAAAYGGQSTDPRYGGAGGQGGNENQSRSDVPTPVPGVSVDPNANMSTPQGGQTQAPAPQVPPPSQAQPQAQPTPQGGGAPAGGQSQAGAQAHIVGRDDKSGNTLYRMPDGSIWEQTPGSAGSPGGLKLKTQSEKGGIPEDPRYTQGMAQNNQDAQTVLKMSYETGVKQAAYNDGYNKAAAKAAAASVAEAAARKDAAEKEVKVYDQRRQQAVTELANFKLDPDRDVSPGQKVLRILAAGLGTFAAIRSKTPNYAMQMLEAQTKQRIQQQEAEMRVLGGKADNSLVDLKTKLGSLDAAKSAYSSAADVQAALQFREMAGKTGDEQTRNNYLDMANKLEARHLKETEEDRIRRLGEVTKNFQNMPKVAPTAGGYRPGTMGQTQSAATLDKTQASTAAAAAKANTPGAIPRSLQQRDASANSAVDMNERLLKLYGIKGDERVGYLEGKGKDIQNTLNPQNDREIRAIYKTYREERFKAITGGAPTESVMKEIDHDAEHKSTAQIITDLQNDKKSLKGVLKYDQDQRTNQPEVASPEAAPEE